MPTLNVEDFPHFERAVRAKWAPILLAPILGSPEQLVVAIAAVSENSFHIEVANALRRLECLFGNAAQTAIFAAEVAIEELRADLARRGIDALANPAAVFSGVSIGTISEGEGETLEQLAGSWMATLSSLYTDGKLTSVQETAYQPVAAEESAPADRLPTLVLDYVSSRRPELTKFFNEQIREQRIRRRHAKAHNVIIDFAGSRLVANFGTLGAASRPQSVDRIKRKIFDLIVDRDSELDGLGQRPHEMIVYHPAQDDPTISERQFVTMSEALRDLADQSRKEDIDFQGMTAVPQIGNRILEAEVRIAH